MLGTKQRKGHFDPKNFACRLCDDMQGVIVKTNIGWVHLTCVNWIPEIWFKEKSENTIVEGKLQVERTKLNCIFCRNTKSKRRK